MAEQRYVLALVYQAGRDDAIVKGLDKTRDYFTADELELAAWSFLPGGGEVGLLHSGWKTGAPDPALMGHARVVENYIYRGPDWQMGETLIKAGDWLAGLICDDLAWGLVKSGKITGLSPQGSAKRRKPPPPLRPLSAALKAKVAEAKAELDVFEKVAKHFDPPTD